jgi:hypothetical protein
MTDYFVAASQNDRDPAPLGGRGKASRRPIPHVHPRYPATYPLKRQKYLHAFVVDLS